MKWNDALLYTVQIITYSASSATLSQVKIKFEGQLYCKHYIHDSRVTYAFLCYCYFHSYVLLLLLVIFMIILLT